jgi:HKD family nuclease
VLAPYIDTLFLKTLIEVTKPQQLRVIVDDGTSLNEIDSLREICAPCKKTRIGLASTRGLAHLKGYYLVFKSKKGSQYSRRFIFGSCNATEAAFGGNRNAELFSVVDLKWPEDKKIIGYCRGYVRSSC